MAFSFGAAAGGAADTLEKILAERRADALVRQKQTEDAADRELRNRQLAQQLQIAQMENQRQMASNAGAALAKIRTDREKGLEEAVKAFAGMTPADQGLITPGGLDLERQAQEVEALGGYVPSLAGVQRTDVPALVGPEPDQGGYLPGTLQAQLADMAPTQRPVGRFFQRVPTAEETETAQAADITAGVDMARPPAERLQQIGEAKKRVAGLSPRVATQVRSNLAALEATTRQEAQMEAQGRSFNRLERVADLTGALAQERVNELRRQREQRAQLDQLTPDQREVATAIVSSVPESRTAAVAESLGTAAARTPQAFADEARRQVLMTLGADDRRQTTGRLGAIDALTRLQTLFADLPTGVVSGTVQNFINQRLGRAADPRLVKAQAAARTFLQNYRRSMTGVAFGKAEAAEYNQFVPDITNASDLNLAQIEGFASALIDNNNAFWNTMLGERRAKTIGVWKKVNTLSGPEWEK